MIQKYTLLFLTLVLLSTCKEIPQTTTFYLIRHAEKVRTDASNKNPDLNAKGKIRAAQWASYFDTIPLNAIYSTKYNRTIQTATPTALKKNLSIKHYNPRTLYDSVFKKETLGKTVLIVGHSNTTPAFANSILKTHYFKEANTYTNMSDSDNATLFIVKLKGQTVSTHTRKVN